MTNKQTVLKRLLQTVLTLVLMGCVLPSFAILTIEVTSGTIAGIPIAIVPFAMEGVSANSQQPADIIDADLSRSGRFGTLPRSSFLSTPHDLKSVQFKDWRLLKSEALVVGKVIKMSDSQYEVRFHLIDVFRGKQLSGQKFVIEENKLRQVSHLISDAIYQELTGIAGAFNTKIVYVTVQQKASKRRYLLQVADADGWNPQTIFESNYAILSPSWSHDGNHLAYVSFEKNRSMVFVQNVRTGSRIRIAEFPGLNSAPAWSPDDKKLALTLSKDGNPEIYIFELASSTFRRVTHHTNIDTEPAWSPDGRSLIFTSSRSGKAQIYQIPANGGATKRLTFSGIYNAGASFSPDGQSIVLITNQGNGYKVGLYSTKDRTIRELTQTKQDESPSFAPNGDVIMYATQKGGQNVLATVSTNGQVQQTMNFEGDSIREPAWASFNLNL